MKHRARPLLGAAALGLLAACASSPSAPPPVISLHGVELEPADLPEGRAEWLQLELDAAMAAWQYAPSEMRAVWVGRRLAYMGRYAEALAWYRGALETYPESYRLRRHAGHRMLTVRQVDAAVAILSEAKDLARAHPNRLEPDGAPGPSGEPRSTTHGNIDYHLALAHYVRGEFDRSAELWLGCVTEWARNDDSRIAALHWAYTSLVRAGRSGEARAALDLVPAEPDVIENFAYADLVRLYRGAISAEQLLAREDRSAALDYGLARHLLATGDGARGEQLLRDTADRPDWPAFGVLAAEADVARERGPGTATGAPAE